MWDKDSCPDVMRGYSGEHMFEPQAYKCAIG
jgi:hypothetical protein